MPRAPRPPRSSTPVSHVARCAGATAPASAPAPRVHRARLPAPLERGTKVRVLEGPFAGEIGVVQEDDGKGKARVMVGLIAVRLDVKNLVAQREGSARPRLSSSHRKPRPARS